MNCKSLKLAKHTFTIAHYCNSITVIAVGRPETVARRRLALRLLQAGEFHRVGGRAGTDALDAQRVERSKSQAGSVVLGLLFCSTPSVCREAEVSSIWPNKNDAQKFSLKDNTFTVLTENRSVQIEFSHKLKENWRCKNLTKTAKLCVVVRTGLIA